MSEQGSPIQEQKEQEHLNIKVTDNNNEVFFKIKRTTQLSKLMNAFCDRQGKNMASVRFLFDGQRVQPTDNPDSVRQSLSAHLPPRSSSSSSSYSYSVNVFADFFSPHSSTCRTATRSKSTRSKSADASSSVLRPVDARTLTASKHGVSSGSDGHDMMTMMQLAKTGDGIFLTASFFTRRGVGW